MLFVYGTLQDPDVLGAVLGRPVDMSSLRHATAPGYRAVFYPGRVYPALVRVPAATASGLLLEGLSQLDLSVLDAFEGDEYRRDAIIVRVAGEQRQAGTYLPAIPIAATAPAWSLAAWTALHKPAVIAQETDTAASLRQRLSARKSD
ncbi:gamma-glutamylcyclotransferase family protein [Devosia sp.]|uniref:gamma-glutamylcyclotransferase family protein n=1 Tax=Devosia sp. TaxID=1871048 RepID=UPI002FCACDF2